jgi:hypothetical protein
MISGGWSPVRAILTGGALVGVLDGCDAVIVWGLRGAPPTRIFQAIAAGLLGRSAFGGGLATALLGVLLHFFIATAIAATYVLASRRLVGLTGRAVAWGLLYGVLVYFFMNFVVVPLSAAPEPRLTPALFVNGILIHALGVGLPSALVARRVAASPSR